jgi:hypothetical protein
MNSYQVKYETEYRGRRYTLTQQVSAPTQAQALVAFYARKKNDFSVRVHGIVNDQHSR